MREGGREGRGSRQAETEANPISPPPCCVLCVYVRFVDVSELGEPAHLIEATLLLLLGHHCSSAQRPSQFDRLAADAVTPADSGHRGSELNTHA